MFKSRTVALFVCLFNSYVFSKLERDSNTFQYYCSGVTNIDQKLYHQLVWECKKIRNYYENLQKQINAQTAGMGHGNHNTMYGAVYIQQQITVYLQSIGTLTSTQLLKDLVQINFIV